MLLIVHQMFLDLIFGLRETWHSFFFFLHIWKLQFIRLKPIVHILELVIISTLLLRDQSCEY